MLMRLWAWPFARIIPQSTTAQNEKAHLLAHSLSCPLCLMVASLAPVKPPKQTSGRKRPVLVDTLA